MPRATGKRHRHKGPADCAALAHLWDMPLASVHEAADLFKAHAALPGYSDKEDILRDGLLDPRAMQRLTVQLSQNTASLEDHNVTPEEILGIVDRNIDGNIDFHEFACWYNERAFLDYMNLTKEEIRVRNVGARLGVPVGDMDQYKAMFDKFDEDKSGVIDRWEFNELMHILMKIPKGHRIPNNRLHHFWKECDLNGNGNVDLHEFVSFYVKNFSIDSLNPMQDYYQSLRRVRP